jgi:PhnB protein
MTAVKPIPDAYPRLIPYLSIDGASAAIDFYIKVFAAKERVRMAGPEGKIGHAELEIGDSLFMLADAFPDMGNQSPQNLGGTPVTMMVYVEDVDAVFDNAIKAGAIEERKVENQFYGDRAGQFKDPFGHKWFVATHVEDVSPEEMAKRAAAVTATAD